MHLGLSLSSEVPLAYMYIVVLSSSFIYAPVEVLNGRKKLFCDNNRRFQKITF